MVDAPGLASEARRLLRSTEAGSLGSAARTFVLTHEGRPLLAGADLRPGAAELSVAGTGADAARVTVAGALRAATPAEAARFAAFSSDAPVLCLEPASVRVESAAGTASLAPDEFLLATPEWLEGEQGILDHMNEDHEDSMLRMSLHYFGTAAKTARLIAADPEGLHVRTDLGVQYFPFDRHAKTHDDVHHATVHLARTARIALAAKS